MANAIRAFVFRHSPPRQQQLYISAARRGIMANTIRGIMQHATRGMPTGIHTVDLAHAATCIHTVDLAYSPGFIPGE
ncbi:MAG: hypothetical protein OXI43_04810, partial [Candidatus Poribacteria bacterium]|nr:hypothetical protein [Candidatus Poribacteria bacterium]